MCIEVECYEGDGRYYGGAVNTTAGGLTCQRWSAQYPHRHTFRPHLAAMLDGADNSCRNVGGVHSRPWCYTVEPDVRWQYCNVSVCGLYKASFPCTATRATREHENLNSPQMVEMTNNKQENNFKKTA